MNISPTPWVATGWKRVVVNDANGNTLALCPGTALEEYQANARLISAAPELLEALEAAVGVLDWAIDNGACKDAVGAMKEFARAAIDKAMGISTAAE